MLPVTTTKNGHHAETETDYAEVAHKAGHKLREALDTASDVTNKTIKEVREKPVQSSLIALGVGFLTGMLFRRRS